MNSRDEMILDQKEIKNRTTSSRTREKINEKDQIESMMIKKLTTAKNGQQEEPKKSNSQIQR